MVIGLEIKSISRWLTMEEPKWSELDITPID